MDPITVLIADAHAPLRRWLSRFLAQHEDIQVVGRAADGRRVLSWVESLQPDILLLDMQMPNLGGLEVLARIRAKSPRMKILILADAIEEDFIARVLRNGVHGCVRKTALPTELVQAIRTIYGGELWAERKLLTRVVEDLRQSLDKLQGSLSAMREVLSEREQEVVIWAVQGMTNKEIATQLGISAKTVKTHLQNVFRKLHVRRRVQLPALSPHLGAASSRAVPMPPPAD
ncbi:MAG: response regulator [Candidatus Entotheonellia bacterium]